MLKFFLLTGQTGFFGTIHKKFGTGQTGFGTRKSLSRRTLLQIQFLMEITNLLLFLVKICTWKMKIVKYECISACNLRHFNNFIRNNCSNYTHKFSFWWALIWYKILCSIIYIISCRGGVMVMWYTIQLHLQNKMVNK